MGEVDGSGLAEDGGGSDVVGNGAVVGLKVDVVVMKGVCEDWEWFEEMTTTQAAAFIMH